MDRPFGLHHDFAAPPLFMSGIKFFFNLELPALPLIVSVYLMTACYACGGLESLKKWQTQSIGLFFNDFDVTFSDLLARNFSLESTLIFCYGTLMRGQHSRPAMFVIWKTHLCPNYRDRKVDVCRNYRPRKFYVIFETLGLWMISLIEPQRPAPSTVYDKISMHNSN